ncbi:kinesin-like protein KIN-8A [Canna indica]|uniref:Kinesin-like protein KIN-8A n=1 Tax=Canna indica TaxID=4628 RepID=A0AAQ3QB69_9LILI|nr:kinesin-like protein KIN-8A [Canna indica]
MPVSTRAQISASRDLPASVDRDREGHPVRARLLRDPHHGLREKLRALTLMYEQQRSQAALRSSTSSAADARVLATHHPSVELSDSARRRRQQEQEKPQEPEERGPIRRESVSNNHVELTAAADAAKENREVEDQNRMLVFSSACPKKMAVMTPGCGTAAAPQKLSLRELISAGMQSEAKLEKSKVGSAQMGAAVAAENREVAGSRINVFVRLRPMAKKEKDAGSRSCVKIVNRKDVYLTEFASETDYLRLKRVRGRHFCFDASFPDSTSQQQVYSTTTADLVEGVLQGRNGSVFCYGATGAGKTYTMLGTLENPGVMVLAIKDLFAKIRQRSYDGDHSVQLSYLEVYNETVRDLLSPGRPLVLREDKQGIIAAGLTQFRAYTTDEVMTLLQQGNQNRTTEPTRVNETSSRSHAILQVVAEYKCNDSGIIVKRIGKLSLIDLAGSERALATDQRTQRSIEGANINRSLLALSSCINALVEGKKHIPYRNSKLTQLLKDSLGGPCNTVMIANISPSNLSFGETQNTLHWADRAKEIKTKGCASNEESIRVPDSEVDQAKLVLELQKENSDLRQQLVHNQQKMLTIQAQTFAASPAPSIAPPSSALNTPSSTQRKVKRSILSNHCFSTPESKNKAMTGDTEVQELRKTVKALKSEMEKLKKEHLLQLKQKDDFIRDLITKYGLEGQREKRVVTRSTLRKGGEKSVAGELKSPNHRFASPAPTAKKRSFWDITTGNSPSVAGRKTRSHVEAHPTPSMLLQVRRRHPLRWQENGSRSALATSDDELSPPKVGSGEEAPDHRIRELGAANQATEGFVHAYQSFQQMARDLAMIFSTTASAPPVTKPLRPKKGPKSTSSLRPAPLLITDGSAVNKRRRYEQRPHQQQHPQSGTLTFDEISKLFSLPIAEAAPILGVCTSVLKKICRDYGIVRWPYRKFLAGKTLEDIRRDVAKERTKELTDVSKSNQRNNISNVISIPSGSSAVSRTTNPSQDSSIMQRVSVPGHASQLQGNRFMPNGWPNTAQLSQSKNIPTFMDEFKYGFPANGLTSTSVKWWGVSGQEDTERTVPAESTTEKDENKEVQEQSNGEEPDSGAEDSLTETKPSALLCSLRRKSVEYGRESLKRGISVACTPNKLTKRQKLTLTQIFGPSLPQQWKDNFS